MSTKHTPGPWSNDGDYIRAAAGNNRPDLVRIAEVFAGWTQEQTNANARLIAAAPELLAALQEILAAQSLRALRRTTTERIARAAIAKAVQS
jgi:Ser/Thr protein kinase RdoA (MazF antagonist)